MSEERIGGGSSALTIIVVILIIGLTVCGTILCVIPALKSTNTNTKSLTILHAWEEGGQYYFADELGCVYHIACERDLWAHPQEEIRYDDMPKMRFDRLEEGQSYNVEYVVRQGDVRLSLGEKEMVG